MTDMICNWAQKCTLRCLGRNAHDDGLNCDTGHCELDVHCAPVSNELSPEVTNLVTALREVEWLPESIERGEFEVCPWCDNFSHRGHADDCKRQTALAPFDTKEPE